MGILQAKPQKLTPVRAYGAQVGDVFRHSKGKEAKQKPPDWVVSVLGS
jgi:hypothetical protein